MTTPVHVPMRDLLRELKEDLAVDRVLTILKKLGETYTASSQHGGDSFKTPRQSHVTT